LNQKINEQPLIVGFSMVRNEEDVIEQFVRQNLYYINLLCVLDNSSVDNTRNILKALQHEGLPLIIIDDPNPAYVQAEKITRILKHIEITLFPDFIVPLDADEFIKCKSRKIFLEELYSIPSFGKGFINWQTYIVPLNNNDSPPSDVIKLMTRRRRVERPEYKKVILRLDGELLFDVHFKQGNHDIDGINYCAELDNIKLAHFPVRSKKQLIEKSITGWMAYLLKSPNARYEGQGVQWLEIFDKVKNDIEFDYESLLKFSVNYVQYENENWLENMIEDPMRFHYDKLLYSNMRISNSISKIARIIENNLAVIKDEFIDYFKDHFSKKKAELQKHSIAENINSTEIFENNWHYDNFYFDIPPIKDLCEKYHPKSVLDIGCGLGQYLLYFNYKGANRITGIDGISTDDTLLRSDQYIQLDLNNGFDLQKKYDLVICLETLEHVEENTSLKLMKSISEHAAEMILFSAAEPDQPGVGHINCKPVDYWIAKWNDLGWVPMSYDTLAFRMISTFSWFKRNTLILRKKYPDVHLSTELLSKIGRKKYTWWNQRGQIVQYPLTEDLNNDIDSTNEYDAKKQEEIFTKCESSIRIPLEELENFRNIEKAKLKENNLYFTAITNDPIIHLPKIDITGSNKVIIRIKLTSPTITDMHLYYKTITENKYCEQNSIHYTIQKELNNVLINLPEIEIIGQLRLDPGCHTGEYILHDIEIFFVQ